MSFTDLKKFKPSTRKQLKRYHRRAMKKDAAKGVTKEQVTEAFENDRKRALKIIRASKGRASLLKLFKQERSKAVRENRVKLMRFFCGRMLEALRSQLEHSELLKSQGRKQSFFSYPVHYPDLHPGQINQFAYDLWGSMALFGIDHLDEFLSIAVGKTVKISDVTITRALAGEALLQACGLVRISNHEFKMSSPSRIKKLWLRFRRKYTVGSKKLFNKSKKTKNEDSEVKKGKKWLDKTSEPESEDEGADVEKKTKKKLKEKPSKKDRTEKKSKKEKRKEKKTAREEKPEKKRTRLPNINDETMLRSTGVGEYQRTLGKIYDLIPKKWTSLKAINKLAKKEGHDLKLVRQYISIFRKGETVETK